MATKRCSCCGQSLSTSSYIKTKNPIFQDGFAPICNSCIKSFLVSKQFEWAAIDNLCRTLDIPFIPKRFEELRESAKSDVFPIYASTFSKQEYEKLDWTSYYKAFKELEEKGCIENEIPLLSDQRRNELRAKWGGNYDDEALNYLENLLKGLISSQNINGALQSDQALKICKISYELDCRIRSGQDFDKILTAYDKLVKTAEFTPKTVKNANDFESLGELIRWEERRGWKNQYYTDVTKDVVDETIKNIQNYNRNLYINESGIGDEITRRIEALKQAEKPQDNIYNLEQVYDIDQYDVDGYDRLMEEQDGEFNA